MLEILILFVCGKKIAAICREKNRAAWPWVLMMVFFWYGGAVAGAIVGVIASEISEPQANEPDPVMLLGGAIGGAVLGIAGALFALSQGHSAPAKPVSPAAATVAVPALPPAPTPIEPAPAPVVTVMPETKAAAPAVQAHAEVHAAVPHVGHPPSKPRTPKAVATSPGF